MSFASQTEYRVRFDWGLNGAGALADSEALVIVDVLSFSTCVDILVSQNGCVFPFRYKDERAEEFARDHVAMLAGPRDEPGSVSLSPLSLLGRGPIAVVLPSPNGSVLTEQLSRKSADMYCACLRNADAVASALSHYKSINVIAAGERWKDGTLRFAIEDLLGAGAVISALSGQKSPEALIAVSGFMSAKDELKTLILQSASGKELVERGFERDVDIATDYNSSSAVSMLRDGAYRAL